MTAAVYRGAKDPESYVLVIRQGASGLDLSTVTAVNLQVTRNTGTSTWTTTLSEQSATSLKATHVFDASGNDVPIPDELTVLALLTLSGGAARRAGPVRLIVT